MSCSEIFGRVYKITNLINGKLYIGQTTQPVELRFKQHCYCSSNSMLISRSIKKYGKENFIIEVLKEFYNRKDMDEYEEFAIKEFNSLKPNGYNIRHGSTGSVMNDETKKKLSQSNKGKKRKKESIDKMILTKLEREYPKYKECQKHTAPRTELGKGVTYKEDLGYYSVNLGMNGKKINLGMYYDLFDAQRAYDLGVVKYRDGVGYLNHPEEIDYDVFERRIKRGKMKDEIKKILKDAFVKKGPQINGSTSNYKGVCWNKKQCKWRVSLQVDKINVCDKFITSELAAAIAYDWVVRKFIGLNAYINFPELEGH